MTETFESHVHEAMFFTTQQELRTESTPFLRGALEAGGDAVLACSDTLDEIVWEALGEDERVIRMHRQDIFRKPVTALETMRDFLRDRVQAGSPQVRVICEVDYGSTAHDQDEWGRFESVVNHVLTGFPLWTLCAYDLSRMPETVVRWGQTTHPWVRQGGREVANPAYREPAELLRRPPVGAALPSTRPQIASPDVRDLRALARGVGAQLRADGVPEEATDDLLLALNEVVTNGLRHGTRPVSLRVWLEQGAVVCAVTDQGPGIADPLVGYLPGGGEDLPEGRFGLWLARRLCDEVDLLHLDEGFTVRLVVYR